MVQNQSVSFSVNLPDDNNFSASFQINDVSIRRFLLSRWSREERAQVYLGSLSWWLIPSSRDLECCSCDTITRPMEPGVLFTRRPSYSDNPSVLYHCPTLYFKVRKVLNLTSLQVPGRITVLELKVSFKPDNTVFV